MSDLFGNHIVGFPTRRLISYLNAEDAVIYEPHCEKTGFLPMQKQRHRSALQ